MEVKVYSELGRCPEECPCLDMTVEEKGRCVFVGCSNSEVCAMWDEKIGGEYSSCKTDSQR